MPSSIVLDVWRQRLDRADELMTPEGPAQPLLRSYRELLRLQHGIYTALDSPASKLTGRLDTDLPALDAGVARLLAEIVRLGPPRAAADATELLAGDHALVRALLLDGWVAQNPPFLAKLILQPYAERLARLDCRPSDRSAATTYAACPFCAGPPQLSILRADSASDGGGRMLACAICATAWPFRRVLCAQCGEEDERRLGYYHTPAFDHLRVDACESCGHYLKSVDLTLMGRAVPIVDEIAGAPLDLWATARGYRKVVLNLIGL